MPRADPGPRAGEGRTGAMDGLWGDVRLAARSLARAPWFTLVAVATLALGIGANVAIFSVVEGVLLRPLPYEEPERLVTVWLDRSERDGPVREWLSSEDLADYRAEPGLFEEIGGWSGWSPTLTGLGEPEVLPAAVVTEGLFERVLRVQPFLGRGFLPEEDVAGAAGVAVLSYGFWRDRLGADRSVLGRPLILDEQPYSVVGVMPEGFAPPFVPGAQLWAAARLDPASCGRGCYTIRTVARLAPGLSPEVARERAGALVGRLAEAHPDTNAGVGAALVGLREDLVGPAARALRTLLGAVGLLLLIACANVASLLLSRAAERESELATRVALGAGRPPILRQLLIESLLLAGLGGLGGIALAAWGRDLLVAMAPVRPPGLEEVSVDAGVLAFAGALTLGAALLVGLAPALRASRTDVYARVGGVRSPRTSGGRMRDAMVVTQIALALVLLVGAGLLLRGSRGPSPTDLGFDPRGVLAVGVSLPAARFPEGAVRVGLYDRLLERLDALPGVVAAGGTTSLPLSGDDASAEFRIEGEAPPRPPEASVAWVRPVTRGYFYAMGQRLMEGREFVDSDDADAPPVVVVNERLAERYFGAPGRGPIGARVALGPGAATWRTIVGVVADTRHFSLRDGTRPAMYVPYAQLPRSAMTIVVRTDGDPEAAIPDVRAAVSELDPGLAASLAPMSERIAGAMVTERFLAGLLGIFSLLALALAWVGLYAVLSHRVACRLREMGIRSALGARGDDVRGLVLRRGLALALIGVALGAAGALWLAPALESLPFDVPLREPLTFTVATATLAGVALLASWLPARRAASADPMTVLREE